jgi:hypothetical protein
MWKKGWRCCAVLGIPNLDEDTGATEKISVAASGDIVAMRHAVRRQAGDAGFVPFILEAKGGRFWDHLPTKES